MSDNGGMDITDFLLARIAEDEKRANYYGLALGTDRVLAECAAKRAIIEAHPITSDVVEVSTSIKWGYACETCFSFGDVVEDHGYCDTLRALAAVYKGHPDYRQEWTP